jgi:SAM-dependent methyltransferase
MSYEDIAPYYDEAMTDYSWCEAFLSRLLPGRCNTLLELGCGTGRILEMVHPHANVIAGIDISPAMLEFAADRVPQARLHCMDMSSFDLPLRFDVILCLFDTMNHLQSISAWHSCIQNVSRHLQPGGMFIMDMNTPLRLSRISLFPPDVRHLSHGGAMIMEVIERTPVLFDFSTEIYAPEPGGMFSHHETVIREFAPEPRTVHELLSGHFSTVAFYDEDNRISDDLTAIQDGRVFFVCTL